jgi:hypothetical protein
MKMEHQLPWQPFWQHTQSQWLCFLVLCVVANAVVKEEYRAGHEQWVLAGSFVPSASVRTRLLSETGTSTSACSPGINSKRSRIDWLLKPIPLKWLIVLTLQGALLLLILLKGA